MAPDRVKEANAYIRTDFETEDAFEAQRATSSQALNQMRAHNIPIGRRIDGRLTPETTAQVRKIAATIEPPPIPPAAAVQEVADESQLPLLDLFPDDEAVPTPTPPPPPTVAAPAASIDVSLKKQPDGSWATADGFTIRKAGKHGYQVELEGDDFGRSPSCRKPRTRSPCSSGCSPTTT